MATNPYFSNYSARWNEQRLVEDLIVESIKMMGADSYYLPNDNEVARDLIYGEDPLKKFTSAYMVEIYPETVVDYSGEKDFFSKFGLEIRNSITVMISRRTFDQRVANGETITRPREGDLVFIPVMNNDGELYEITKVTQNKDFNLMGRKFPFFYQLSLEKFKYSNEKIDTGVTNIDLIQKYETITQRYYINNVHGTFTEGEIVYQSADATYANAFCSATVATYSSVGSYIDINYMKGLFLLNTAIYGQSSSANAVTLSTVDHEETQHYAFYDNKDLNTEGGSYRDNTEINPFGNI